MKLPLLHRPKPPAPKPSLASYRKRFMDCLYAANNNSGSIQPRQIFQDFLFLSSTALRQGINTMRNQFCDELEQSYLTRVKRYPNANAFAEAQAVLTLALEQEAHDFLGAVYMEIDSSNARTGQFFTPQHLSDACAMMALGLTKEDFQSTYSFTNRFRVSEPCCGAGSMVIACMKVMRKLEAHPMQWYVEAIDLDLNCVQMCYIQMFLLGIPGEVYCGNTLGVDCGKKDPPWITLTGTMFPSL